MLKIGCGIVTFWAVSNAMLSTMIVVETLFRGGHTPALYLILTESDVESLSPETLATIDSLVIYANGLNIAFCVLATGLIWQALGRRQTWSFVCLSAGFAIVWVTGVAADFVVGNAAPWVNIVSFLILLGGFAFSTAGLFRHRSPSTPGYE